MFYPRSTSIVTSISVMMAFYLFHVCIANVHCYKIGGANWLIMHVKRRLEYVDSYAFNWASKIIVLLHDVMSSRYRFSFRCR